MMEAPPAQTAPLTIREFRGRLKKSSLDELCKLVGGAFLPQMLAIAQQLIPENVESQEKAVFAVFQTFALRCKKLSGKTVLITWFARTSYFASLQQRKLASLPKPATASGPDIYSRFFRRLFNLPNPWVDAVLLRNLGRLDPKTTAEILRKKPKKTEKWNQAGLKCLNKWATRYKIPSDVAGLLAALVISPDPAMEAACLPSIIPGPVAERKTRLVSQTISKWRWVAIRRFARGVLAAFGGVVAVLAILVGIFAYLATHGYLTAWFIRNGSRQIAKDVPELLIPAKQWPVTESDKALTSLKAPATSRELYGLSNIWVARFTCSSEQWAKIEPSNIEAVHNIMGPNGRITLSNPKAKRNGLAGALGIEFNWTEAKLEFADKTFEQVGLRYRGNGTYLNSMYGPKQSFKVDLNKVVKKQQLAGVKTLNFLNTLQDNTYMKDPLGQKVFQALGVVAPRTSYVYLTLDVPKVFTNQALGLFVLVENIDGDFAKDRFGTKNTPIFKPVTYELFNDWGNDWKAYERAYDLKTSATDEQKQRVIDFAQLTSKASDEEFAAKLPEFLDIDEFAAFVAGHVIMSSYDGFLANGQNYYMYLDPRSNKFGFISWDQDHGWGEFGHIGSVDERENASIWKPSVYENKFLNRVMKVEAFKTSYRAKLELGLATCFNTNSLFEEIDALGKIIRPAVAAESDFRLKRFDQAISSEWLPGERENGEREAPKAPVHQIKRFITNRIQSLREQLDGKSEGQRLKSHFN